MIIATTFLCLFACAFNVRFYLERQMAAGMVTHSAAYTNAFNQREDYFNMSLTELMEVVIVSKTETRPSSQLLNFPCFSDGVQSLT
jgi:hypothetical protein